ncbi:efflux RND transporter periplasmic adaptor subunit [Corticibacter populi]|uniref:Efflux RND transporter periplasmic adaptor subunit n=1 Tax=Corticibacter populi TaxID=1550736 RepID=A0A3M6R0B8_9BURK|nr:efflux RND transporter periplasmic adaptor subunit [Corticibacter populi]RMX08623.1 efflux RND transporter periplasmic adaptor subunit [Corticibacter populi]RZS35953.1 membrane fusion protein (multidrug efflux system) [Corticibacter populi]
MRSPLLKIVLFLALVLAIAAAWWLQQPEGHGLLAKFTAGGSAPQTTGAAAPSGGAQTGNAGAMPLIEVAQAQQRLLRDEVQAVGTLVSRQSTSLRPESSGRVQAIHFRDGQRVRKGQLLLQLDDRLERAQLQQAQAELNLARANHQRNRELVEQGFISQRALDESAANLQVSEARLALAQTAVERLRLLAPFDAIAGIGNVHVGDYLREGDELVNLQDMDVLFVDFRLPERLMGALREGQTTRLMVDALPGESFEAQVMAIDPLVDVQGRSVALRASLPNPRHRLRPGMFARVELLLQERPDAVVVPEQAVLADTGGAALIRVTPWDEALQGRDPAALPAGTAYRTERLPVQLGLRLPGLVEVRAGGLVAGDVVMTAGQHRVSRSGQRVRLRWPQAGATEPLDATGIEGAAAEDAGLDAAMRAASDGTGH